jgi:nucleoredoxin
LLGFTSQLTGMSYVMCYYSCIGHKLIELLPPRCPPCRAFTPSLAQKYKEIISGGGNFEIVFVSSDRDESGAKEYFESMPWAMLDFNDREFKNELCSKFEIQGIPSLIILDEKGDVITDEGREAIMEVDFSKLKTYREEMMRMKNEAIPSEVLFEGNLVGKGGVAVDSSTLKGKTVGYYFSAHWCGPCRRK